jgi:peroxiredoxin
MSWIEFGPLGRQSSVPDFRLQTPDGVTVVRRSFHSRAHLVLCFLPEALSAADRARLQRLADAQEEVAGADARLYALIAAPRDSLPPSLSLLLDPDRAMRRSYAALFPPEQTPAEGEPFVIIVDRYGAPAFAVHGVPDADEVLTRLWGLQYECPE